MKEILVKIKFQRNVILKQIGNYFGNVKNFCKRSGLSEPLMQQYINFKISPVTKCKWWGDKPANDEYYWKKTASRIAQLLHMKEIELFPEHLWHPRSSNHSVEIDTVDMISFDDRLELSCLTDENEYDKEGLHKILATLSPREEAIIRLRYGFDDGSIGETYESIGEKMGVTKERIRQVETKALRKLRHPTRVKYIRK